VLHSPLLPPREPKPAHTGAISISSASSPQCRLISFAAFPLAVFDVRHARLYCSLGGSACIRRITTPLASRATSLHIVALHAVPLLLRFQLPNLCSPGLAALLPRSHRRVRATWAYSCPGRAYSRARQPRLQRPPRALRSTPAHATGFHCVTARMFAPPTRRRSHSLLHCRPCRSRVCVTPARRQLVGHARVCSWAEPRPLPARHAPSLARAHALAPVHLHASRARSALLLLCTPEPHHLLPLAPRLLPSRTPARASSASEPHTNAGLPPSCARSRSPSSCRRRGLARATPVLPLTARPPPPALALPPARLGRTLARPRCSACCRMPARRLAEPVPPAPGLRQPLAPSWARPIARARLGHQRLNPHLLPRRSPARAQPRGPHSACAPPWLDARRQPRAPPAKPPPRALGPRVCVPRLAWGRALRSASAPSRAARRLAPPRARAACCRTEWRWREREREWMRNGTVLPVGGKRRRQAPG
jgi:hypothetical protein